MAADRWNKVDNVSQGVVILTREELRKIEYDAFQRGVERGRFEESYDRSNSPAQGSVGHPGATESTGTASLDAAVRPANSNL